jgi:hypothetical protein
VLVAVAEAVPFRRSPRADRARTQALVDRLRQGGATELCASTMREWVVFRAGSGALVQILWAQ